MTHPELKPALREIKGGPAGDELLMRRVLKGQVSDEMLDAAVARRVDELRSSDGTNLGLRCVVYYVI